MTRALSSIWLVKDKFVDHREAVRSSDDDYLNTKLGLKRRTWWAATIDASYTASEDLVADVFYTYDNQRLYAPAMRLAPTAPPPSRGRREIRPLAVPASPPSQPGTHRPRSIRA